MRATKQLTPVRDAYRDYLKHLKKDHPLLYQRNKGIIDTWLELA